MEDIQVLKIDLFCGAGGVTTGSEKAMINGKKVCKVIAHNGGGKRSSRLRSFETIHRVETRCEN